MNVRIVFLSILLFGAVMLCAGYAVAATGDMPTTEFPPELQSYNDAGQSILERLIHRVKVNPFNLCGHADLPSCHRSYFYGEQVHGHLSPLGA